MRSQDGRPARGCGVRRFACAAWLPLAALLVACPGGSATFPGEHWEDREPAQLGLDGRKLDALARALGGHGAVIVDGYRVKHWGAQDRRFDWFSAGKPVFTTLLFFAIDESLVDGVDARVADFGWALRPADRDMTLWHLANMTSGYARPEPPGAAWAYNDYAIQLYQKTLFERIFRADPEEVANHPARLGALGLEDGLVFGAQRRRLHASVRDFARIAWLWANRGRWDGRQLLAARHFEEHMRPQVPEDLPHTARARTDDYLRVGSFGGESDHLTRLGPGIYGFTWWFNATGRDHPERRAWPGAPADAILALGVRGRGALLLPGLRAVVVAAEGRWGELSAGDPDSPLGRVLAQAADAVTPSRDARADDGVALSGDLETWHRTTLTFRGPAASEDGDPNPFRDYRLDVSFSQGEHVVTVPGFFAADGDAAESGARRGDRWRVHFAPDREGEWRWRASFRSGPDVALADDPAAGRPAAFDGASGSFRVTPANARGRDHRGKGFLRYVGQRYLRFAGTGEWFLKGGANSPENLLAYADFDQTPPTHRYEPHVGDWREGDPTWRGGRGRGLLGALRYLAGKGMNAAYFLTMNVGGDGRDVWPWTGPDVRDRYDTSKLDQWEIVFSQMDRLGILLHVVTQETENDQILDGGALGPERRLYHRELVARFAHHPALVWNLGEENTNSDAERRAFAEHLERLDPYDHPIVVHTHPGRQKEVYDPLLGDPHVAGASLQTDRAHRETLRWVETSRAAGRPWVVTLDEIGPANAGAKPDAADPDHDELRRRHLWPSLLAGGAGVEWYFGYDFPHDDLDLEDWRSRDRLWDQTRHALAFFHQHLPFPSLESCDALLHGARGHCLGAAGAVYAVYLPEGGEVRLDLGDASRSFRVRWYDPRQGGALRRGERPRVAGPGVQALGLPPAPSDADWVALVRTRGVGVPGRLRRRGAARLRACEEIAEVEFGDGPRIQLARLLEWNLQRNPCAS